MKFSLKLSLMTVLLAAFALAAPAQKQPQAKVSYEKVVGTWTLEINAGTEFYYLIMELQAKDGKLEGGLSEQNGMFTNAPLLDAEFDGQTLKFDVKVPTPPDGAERLAKFEMKAVDNKLEGILTITDLEFSAAVTGAKK